MGSERKTKQKCYVRDCLVKNAQRHLTVDNIFEILKEEGLSVSRATIYRCVNGLLKRGVVRQYKVSSSGKACYQYVNESKNCDVHCHLVCLSCEKILHFTCSEILGLQSALKEKSGFLLDIPGSYLYGLCSSCRK